MPVGDVSGKGILMSYAIISLQFGEEFFRLPFADGGGSLTTITRHNGERFRVNLKEAWDILAPAGLKMLQNRDLGLESFLSIEPPESLADASVEPDINPREFIVFPNHGVRTYDRPG